MAASVEVAVMLISGNLSTNTEVLILQEEK
jgi:hypothetical protein